MKFCMVTTFYPPYHFGGDAVLVSQLAGELGRRGHEVDVVHDVDAYRALLPGGRPATLDPVPNVTVHTLSSPFGRLSPLATHQTGLPLFKPGLRRLLESGRHDVIHFHNASLVGPGAFSFGDAVKLYTMHEQWLVCPLHLLWKFGARVCDGPQCVRCCLHARRPPQFWRATGFLRRQLRLIDRFIAPSGFARDLHHELGLDLPVTVLPNFVPNAARVQDAGPRPRNRPYFLFVGRLVATKGLDTVLPAFRARPEVDFVVAGDGEQARALRASTAGASNIVFLGAVPPESLRSLYRHAVALVVPSVAYEVCPMVVLEAFAQGTPVIARDLAGLAEVVGDANGGRLFRDDDGLRAAIAQLLGDQALRDTLGRNGRLAVDARYNADAHLSRYFEIIDDCAARGRRRGGGA